MNLFFYGLFMDQNLLARKGVTPRNSVVGYVDGFRLCIGERATLLTCPGARVYGVMMDIPADEAETLYAEDSVADYLPETVGVETGTKTKIAATCYNLPTDKVTGTNAEYAEVLLKLATRLGFPEFYLGQIQQAERS